MPQKIDVEEGNKIKIDLAAKEYAKNSDGDFNRNFVAFQKGAEYVLTAAKDNGVGMKGEKEALARKALQCLFIEVAAPVAEDVQQKVLDAFEEIRESPSPSGQVGIEIDWDAIEKDFIALHEGDRFYSAMDIFYWFKSRPEFSAQIPVREEKIAVGFTEWIEKEEFEHSAQGWYQFVNSDMEDTKFYTAKELFQLYKLSRRK